MTYTRWAALAVASTLMLGVAAADAAFTCDVVAKRMDIDPSGAPFTNKFADQTAVNESGDVLFVGRAGKNQQALYLYRGGGPNLILARVGDAAPGGSSFGKFARGSFGGLQLNAAGDAAFVGRLGLPGFGVFVLDGGVLEKAAQTTDPSPSGGVFLSFPSLSGLRESGEIAFVAEVSGGPSGVFGYDSVTNTVSAILNTTHVDDGGRPFCTFEAVGYGDGLMAVLATVGVPTCATPVEGVFEIPSAGMADKIALVGDASPIGGTTFADFSFAPESSPTAITFVARVAGTFNGSGVFSWGGGPITKVTATGDAAPVTGGAFKKIGGQHRQTLGDDVFVHYYTRQTSQTQGIFTFTPAPGAAVVRNDTPPAPFGAGAVYRAFNPPAVDGAGSYISFHAKVKDTIKPLGKDAILRCQP